MSDILLLGKLKQTTIDVAPKNQELSLEQVQQLIRKGLKFLGTMYAFSSSQSAFVENIGDLGHKTAREPILKLPISTNWQLVDLCERVLYYDANLTPRYVEDSIPGRHCLEDLRHVYGKDLVEIRLEERVVLLPNSPWLDAVSDQLPHCYCLESEVDQIVGTHIKYLQTLKRPTET